MKLVKTLSAGLVFIVLGSSSLSREKTSRRSGSQDITHERLRCMSPEEFPFVEARVDKLASTHQVGEARVYFRAQGESNWYYVDMSSSGPRIYQTALPRPHPETAKVDYYVEFTIPALDAATTETYTVDVRRNCRGPRLAPPGLTRDIRVGSIEEARDSILTGFSMIGVASSQGFFTTKRVAILSSAGAAGSIALLSTSGQQGSVGVELRVNGQKGGQHSCQRGIFFDVIVNNPTDAVVNVTSFVMEFTTSSTPACHSISFTRPVNVEVPAGSPSQTIVFPRPVNLSGVLCVEGQRPGCDWAVRVMVMTSAGTIEDAFRFTTTP